MASTQKLTSNKMLYIGIGIGIFIIIIVIIVLTRKSKGNDSGKPNVNPVNPNPVNPFPVFPVIPEPDTPKPVPRTFSPVIPDKRIKTDEFIQYYDNGGFNMQSSKIQDDYRMAQTAYDESISQIMPKKDESIKLQEYNNNIKVPEIENNTELNKFQEDIDKTGVIDAIKKYNTSSNLTKSDLEEILKIITEFETLYSESPPVENFSDFENIKSIVSNYEKIKNYVESIQESYKQFFADIKQEYEEYLKSYNEGIKPIIDKIINDLDSISMIVPNESTLATPLYKDNPDNLKKVDIVNEFISKTKQDISNIQKDIMDVYNLAKQNYDEIISKSEKILGYYSKIKNIKEELELLSNIIKIKEEIIAELKLSDDNRIKLDNLRGRVNDFERNFFNQYSTPVINPSEEQISSNTYYNIPNLKPS